MLKLPLAVTAVTSVLVTLATGAVAQNVPPPELPLALMCWNETASTWRVGYLSTVKKDGTATYAALTGQLTGTMSAKGFAEPPSNRPVVLDCYGKTVEQLRALGRVIEFQRAR